MYPRAGALRVDADGLLTDGQGNRLLDTEGAPIQVETADDLRIDDEGCLTAGPEGEPTGQQIGLARFLLAEALEHLGGGRYRPRPGDPAPSFGAAGDPEFGIPRSGALEGSNVDPAEALTTLLPAQRIYALNARAFQSSAELMRLAATLRA